MQASTAETHLQLRPVESLLLFQQKGIDLGGETSDVEGMSVGREDCEEQRVRGEGHLCQKQPGKIAMSNSQLEPQAHPVRNWRCWKDVWQSENQMDKSVKKLAYPHDDTPPTVDSLVRAVVDLILGLYQASDPGSVGSWACVVEGDEGGRGEGAHGKQLECKHVKEAGALVVPGTCLSLQSRGSRSPWFMPEKVSVLWTILGSTPGTFSRVSLMKLAMSDASRSLGVGRSGLIRWDAIRLE